MIALAGDVKVVVATQPVDFRRGINGLVARPLLCVASTGFIIATAEFESFPGADFSLAG
ncbi:MULTISPECIES: hypothetical protein [unclassified Mesorhizobium]|uniref:hypothetical protein n=1 Tax=unclassified Mesorhizobium TaxID=325217 RepID=UPI0003D04EA6|nr:MULTISPECIES: hypothetical protein [unclassified Mesorhizobium]ESZ02171.1 hypothetical protein X736_31010 [Mesorhizobium sp. L2C089B000]